SGALLPGPLCRYRYKRRSWQATEQILMLGKLHAGAVPPTMQHKQKRIFVLSRRDLLVGAGAAALVGAMVRTPALAQQLFRPDGSEEFAAELKKVLGVFVPLKEGIEMELPEAVENGEHVPLALDVPSPMT